MGVDFLRICEKKKNLKFNLVLIVVLESKDLQLPKMTFPLCGHRPSILFVRSFVRSCVPACVRSFVCSCVRAFVRYSMNPSIDIDVHENLVTFMWTYRSVEALIMVLPSKDRCSTPPECPWNDLRHIHIKFQHVVVTVHSCFSQFFFFFFLRERIQYRSGTNRTEK